MDWPGWLGLFFWNTGWRGRWLKKSTAQHSTPVLLAPGWCCNTIKTNANHKTTKWLSNILEGKVFGTHPCFAICRCHFICAQSGSPIARHQVGNWGPHLCLLQPSGWMPSRSRLGMGNDFFWGWIENDISCSTLLWILLACIMLKPCRNRDLTWGDASNRCFKAGNGWCSCYIIKTSNFHWGSASQRVLLFSEWKGSGSWVVKTPNLDLVYLVHLGWAWMSI